MYQVTLSDKDKGSQLLLTLCSLRPWFQNC